MAGLLAVLPILDVTIGRRCVDSIMLDDSAAGLDPRTELLLIDNTRDGDLVHPESWAGEYGIPVYRDPDGHNLGVARAWNVGIRQVLAEDLDYCVLMSASLEFGPELHTTWRKQMETFWDANVIESDGHSWHLIALHRRVFEQVGLFDENFYPAYEEAIDFGLRMRYAGLEGGWSRVWVNVLSHGHGLHVNLNVIDCPVAPLQHFYAAKWMGAKGFEKYDTPFGAHWDEERERYVGVDDEGVPFEIPSGIPPLHWWPERSIEHLVEKYGIERWW